MNDDIIKKKLNRVGLNYSLTPKYFRIPREIKVKPKAPVWFREFEKKNDERWENQIKFNEEQKKFNKRIESKVDKNTEAIKNNTNAIKQNAKNINFIMNTLNVKP